jgi:uncharacterized protein DUF1365
MAILPLGSRRGQSCCALSLRRTARSEASFPHSMGLLAGRRDSGMQQSTGISDGGRLFARLSTAPASRAETSGGAHRISPQEWTGDRNACRDYRNENCRQRRLGPVETLCRRAPTATVLLRSFCSLPLVTLKIVAAIHWQALRLWLKGARLVPRPNAAVGSDALNTSLATRERHAYSGPVLPVRGKCARVQ